MDETLAHPNSNEDCKPCPKGVPMWMATFADMAILLMAFFVLLIAFNKTEKGGAQMTAGSEEGNFGVQNELPVVSRPKGESAIAKSFSPAQVDRTLVKIVREVTTDIRPPKDTPLTRLNRENRFKRNAEIELLEEALAKEIATNRVRVIAGKFKTIVEIPSQDFGGEERRGDYKASGFKVRERDLQIYAKVAEVQAEIEAELEIQHVRQKMRDGEPDSSGKQASMEDQFEIVKQALAAEINRGQAEVIKDEERIIIRLAEHGSFPSGSALIKPSFKRILSKLALSLQEVSGEIMVEGHTDGVAFNGSGVISDNWDLSVLRATTVVRLLQSKYGLDPAKMVAAGRSEFKPVADNSTKDGRAANRRTRIVILPQLDQFFKLLEKPKG